MNKSFMQNRLNIRANSQWYIANPSKKLRDTFGYVHECGEYFSLTGHYVKRRGLKSYLINYTISGEGRLKYGGNTYNLTPGQYFWINCLEPQYYEIAESCQTWHVSWVHCYGHMIQSYYREFLRLNGGSHVCKVSDESNVLNAITGMCRIFSQSSVSYVDEIQTSILLNTNMGECIKSASAAEDNIHLPPLIKKIRQYLLDKYDTPVDLNHLAKEFLLNKYTLQKTFKHHLGETPYEFLRKQRLKAARELLRNSTLSVSEIALVVGYSHANRLIEQFKKEEGITPLAFRKVWYDVESQ